MTETIRTTRAHFSVPVALQRLAEAKGALKINFPLWHKMPSCATTGDDLNRFAEFTENFATWVMFYGPEGGEAIE